MIGTTVSHYQILEKLGAGGMGVVYRARDKKLGRDVAIKVLPAEVSNDAERLSRFEREARLLASLNHPHVATLFGFEEASGTRFLVMELVEGETLADRIARGPLPIDEALALFCQIAEGLEAAHDKGIIHRDLKPSNVKLTPEGKVKVLDFGLAKTFASRESGPQSESPTVTRSPTESGVILGTAAYMSPEQARGKTLDKRTDIWAFGCCLFEALTGRTAFLGETVSDTLARILEREPAWTALPGRTPRRIRELLASCLTKDPANRLRDIGDARIEIAKALAQPEVSPRQDKRVPIAAVAIALVMTAIGLWSLTRARQLPALPVLRAIMPLPDGESLYEGASVAISPDGRFVAYVTGDKSSARLYLRRIDELEARRVEGGEGADAPFFSSDSEWVGFVKGQTVLRAAVSGGAPVSASEIRGFAVGLDWRDDAIVQGDVGGGLFRVRLALDGGEREVVTTLHPEQGEKSHRFPHVLPGGDGVLFTLATSTTDSWDDASIAVASMATREYKVVLAGGSQARYSPTGHLVYARIGTLFAVAFDLEKLEVTGQPVPVLRGVMTYPRFGGVAFALSETGSLVYAPGLSKLGNSRVVWVDRNGRTEPLIENLGPLQTLDLSPDGRLLAIQNLGGIDHIWLYDLEHGTLSRWSSEWDHMTPAWAPSGREIAFASARGGVWGLYKQALDIGAKEELLTTSEYMLVATSWSPDGAVLLFDQYGVETGADVRMLSLSGDSTPEPLLRGRANENWAAFSPNGKWIAYQSDETGRFEVYLRPFPTGGEIRQVSSGGGDHPTWNPNGGELFYASGDKMMAVTVKTEGGLFVGRPSVLFERRRNPELPNFTVTPDGQRFIYIDDSVAESAPTHLVLVQNFGEELKRLVPVRD